MKFSVKYMPTALFSLKESNSTNSGAKSLFLPSPYAIKMAVLNQAITVGGKLSILQQKNSREFRYIRDAKISFYIEEGSFFTVNNSFVKILKPARSGGGFQQTVAFREYLHLSNALEIIFEVEDENGKLFLNQYLHKINYFGKKGCFFQFMEYSDNPNKANVTSFDIHNLTPGILQEFDDFDEKSTFENANSFSTKKSLRKKAMLVLPITKVSTSKSYSVFRHFKKEI